MNFETPHITLDYSTGDDGLDFRIEVFSRFETVSQRAPSYLLTFGEVPRMQESSPRKAIRVQTHHITADDIREIVARVRKVKVPLDFPTGAICLGSSNHLTIQFPDLSSASFHWVILPEGWEPVADIARHIKGLRFRYAACDC